MSESNERAIVGAHTRASLPPSLWVCVHWILSAVCTFSIGFLLFEQSNVANCLNELQFRMQFIVSSSMLIYIHVSFFHSLALFILRCRIVLPRSLLCTPAAAAASVYVKKCECILNNIRTILIFACRCDSKWKYQILIWGCGMYKRAPTVRTSELYRLSAWERGRRGENERQSAKDRHKKNRRKKTKQTYKMRMEMIKQLQRDCSKNKVKSIIQLVCCLFISVWVYRYFD